MKDELQQENDRYVREARARAAKIMRDEGLPMFDAMDKAQAQIAAERKRVARSRMVANLGALLGRL